jgi:hypothetical protein
VETAAPTVPVWLLPALTTSDTATPAVPSPQLTATGLERLVNEPSPICPRPPKPQQYGWLLAVRPHTAVDPLAGSALRARNVANERFPCTAVGTNRCVVVPSPICPLRLLPQQYACPVAVRAHVPKLLAVIDASVSPPDTAVGAAVLVVDPFPS